MYKINATLNTAGDGYWSNKAKAVEITALQLAYTNDELDFGELRVRFNTATWDTAKDGLIYTDSVFLDELCALLTQLLLQVQALLEEDYAENVAIQDAFNALACAIDEEIV